jgi:hypothetical protein
MVVWSQKVYLSSLLRHKSLPYSSIRWYFASFLLTFLLWPDISEKTELQSEQEGDLDTVEDPNMEACFKSFDKDE